MSQLKSVQALVVALAVLAGGCAGGKSSQRPEDLIQSQPLEPGVALASVLLSRELEDRILALDPNRISAEDVQNTLSQAPAPRMIGIHGGIFEVYLQMVSFADFLVGMGYPLKSISGPQKNVVSYTCYEDSKKLAGLAAWHYERDAMRPMIVGHSQGGMTAVKVLTDLDGQGVKELRVWNPEREAYESRTFIRDPFDGSIRPVVGLKLSYVTAVGAGGLTRLLVNQWSLIGKLRTIPDTVDEFTGFYMGFDWTGGDLFGFGPMNEYHASGKAVVNNIRLPIGYDHTTVPDTRHLVKDPQIKAWIDAFVPSSAPEFNEKFESSTRNILWAASVWYDLKKHWCLELQRLIRARRQIPAAPV